MAAGELSSRHRRLSARTAARQTRPSAPGAPGDDEPALRELRVTVPLKPQGDAPPPALPPMFTRAAQIEYATQYLARMGARATPENVALALKSLPFENCQIATTWRARGALADELTIDLFPPKPAPLATIDASLTSGDAVSQSRPAGGFTTEEPAASDRDVRASYYCYGPVCWSFSDMKRKFLPPFCEAAPPTSEPRDAPTAVAVEKRETQTDPSDDGGSTASLDAPATGATVSQILCRRETLRRQQRADERRVPPDTRSKTICAMHRAFFSSLPLASLGLATRCATGSDRDLAQRLLDALVSDAAVVELAQSVVLLLYHDVFTPMTLGERSSRATSGVDTLLVDCVRLFATIRSRYGAWRAPNSFSTSASSIVPLILLALRVDVETLFRMQYPQSFSSQASNSTAAMSSVLADMNARLSGLLDPDGHYSRVPALESSCAASAARTTPGFQRQRRRARLREQFFRTSEALHCVFPVPASGDCRRIMAVGGGAQVARYSSIMPDTDTNSADAIPAEAKIKLLRVLQRK